MPLFDYVKGVSIPEIVCAFPEQHMSLIEYAPNLLNEKNARRMAKSTGFGSLRIAPEGMTTADFFVAAAEKLLEGRNRQDIAAIVFVTQTPDYDIPATSYAVQHRLGLSSNTLCMDFNEGCTGFIKGFYLATSLVERLKAPVLLGVGDTLTKLTSPDDRSSRCLFGDDAAAILVEPGEQNIPFAFTSYGDRKDYIIMENSAQRKVDNPVNDGYLYLSGLDIFNFSCKEVPEVINAFMSRNGITDGDITLYAFHQANRLILESLAEKLGLPTERIPFVAEETGNLSGASIPSVIVQTGGGAIHQNVLCCGFGAGLSVGVCLADFSGTKTSEVFIS